MPIMPHMPDFLQAIAEQASAYQQAAAAGNDAAALRTGWRRWAELAGERIPGLQLVEEQATAQIGQLSQGCQACKSGTWDCIFLTMQCNLRCAFCCSPTGFNQHTPGSAFGSDIEAIAAHYAQTHIQGISFSGGEPFLDPERLLNWVQAFHARFPGSYLWIYTNGWLANGPALRALARLGVNELRFNPAGSGYSHPRVLDNIRCAANLFPQVTVEIPAVPGDRARLLAALPAWAEAGVRYLNLHELMAEPGTPSARLPGPRQTVRLPDGHQTEIHPGSSALVLEVMEAITRDGLPLAVNYCSLLNKIGQVRRRRERLLPLIQAAYELAGWDARGENPTLTSCVLYDSPARYQFCHPDHLAETLARFPGWDWARITRLAPLALHDQGGWIDFSLGPDMG